MKRCTYFLVAVFVIGLFSLTLTNEAAADNIFVWIHGIPGESTDKDHKDWIEAESITIQLESNLKGGQVNSGTLVVSKQLDKATPKLGHYCTSGQHIKEVKIELTASYTDAGRVPYMLYKLQNVTVTSSFLAAAKGGKIPIEEVTLRFVSIDWNYTSTGPTGAKKGTIKRRFVPRKY